MIVDALTKLLARQDLTEAEAEAVMTQIMTGAATPAQVGGYLMALRMKGESVPEITGSARAMRQHATQVQPHNGQPLLDTAGTGGDGSHSFNISTTAAFVIAGAGYKVAKHGNRGASSQCGSADVLEALGVNLDLTPEQVAECINTVGIGFLFAPKFHPAMRHAIGPRRELRQRTIFNLLGPLTNPAGATHQLIGVYDPALTEPLAYVLDGLGVRAAMVVHGAGGLDELTVTGENTISHLQPGGQVTSFTLHARELGLTDDYDPADLKGGMPPENAAILYGVLSGKLGGIRRDTVLLNAAAALAAETGDFKAALAQARESLTSGAALAKLERLIAATQAVTVETA